jgi:hypothetical protein
MTSWFFSWMRDTIILPCIEAQSYGYVALKTN